jgi:hypothetical protein
MSNAAIKQMLQLLLTEPHAPTVCEKLERIAREALANHCEDNLHMVKQEQGEPVAADDFFRMIADKNPSPFSTQQRTWVGLTDEEVINVMPDDDTPISLGEAFSKFAELIEAKLKEKNT